MISSIKQITILKRCIILLAFFSVTACSYSPDALRNYYNKISTDFSDDIKNYSDFNAEQNAKIDDYSRQLMQWHRQNKLPEYSQSLSTLATLISQDSVTTSSLKPIINQLDGLPHFAQANHLTHKMADVAQTMSASQVDQLASHIKNEHQQVALEIEQTGNVKDISKSIRYVFDFLGVDLGVEQQRIISTEASKFHDIRKQELQAEIKDDNYLITLLRKPQDAQFIYRFKQHWDKQGPQLPAQLQSLELDNKRLFAHLISELIMSMDLQQKAVLTEKLYSISQTFAAMANE